jgi:transportin-3
MATWKNVLATVGSALGNEAGDCVLEFLKILPEEVTEGRKINLTVCSAESPSCTSIYIHLSAFYTIQQRHLFSAQRLESNPLSYH